MNSLNESFALIGLKAKTGRAIAVVLRGPVEAPQVIKRTELMLTDPLVPATFQPYHEVMELPWAEAERKVAPFIRAIEKVAAKSLAQLVGVLQSEGLRIAGVGIAGSADRDLGKIGNYHIRAHAAEGLLFRRALEFAAQANKLPHRIFVEKGLQTQAASERLSRRPWPHHWTTLARGSPCCRHRRLVSTERAALVQGSKPLAPGPKQRNSPQTF